MLERPHTPASPVSLCSCPASLWDFPLNTTCFVTGWNSLSFCCMRTPQQCQNILWSPWQQQEGLGEPRLPHSHAFPLHTTPQPCAGKPCYFKLFFPLLPLSSQASQEIGEQQFPCCICSVVPTVLPSGDLPTAQKVPVNPTPQGTQGSLAKLHLPHVMVNHSHCTLHLQLLCTGQLWPELSELFADPEQGGGMGLGNQGRSPAPALLLLLTVSFLRAQRCT